MSALTLNVNGEALTVDVDETMPLLWVLRDILGMTGTKYSCGEGHCGACTVHIDGKPRKSCGTPVGRATEKVITTIEGLSPDGSHPVQQAWLAEHVAQCGYCQPGQIMTAAALLTAHPKPTDAQINAAMGDVLCRCGTYQRIRRAILAAAEMEA